MAEYAALGMQVAGGIINAYGTLEEGSQAHEMGVRSQQQYLEESKSTMATGAYESRGIRVEAEQTEATQRANMLANGGLLTGTNRLIIEATAKNYETDALVLARNYTVEAVKLQNQGAMMRYQGDLARRNSRIRALAGVFTGMSQMTPTIQSMMPATTRMSPTNQGMVSQMNSWKPSSFSPTMASQSTWNAPASSTKFGASMGAGFGIW